jgi:hypothetical protein
MPSRQRMTMRAFLQRNSASADSYGHERPGSWGALSTTPCWAWVDREETSHGPNASLAAARYKAIVPLGTDVTESDRVEKVEERNTDQVFGLMYIDAVITRRDHIELRMRGHA